MGRIQPSKVSGGDKKIMKVQMSGRTCAWHAHSNLGSTFSTPERQRTGDRESHYLKHEIYLPNNTYPINTIIIRMK